jgi:hypothetical protein
MTLAPIRGAPPGAPIPDFPTEEAKVTPAKPTAAPAPGEPAPKAPSDRDKRQSKFAVAASCSHFGSSLNSRPSRGQA